MNRFAMKNQIHRKDANDGDVVEALKQEWGEDISISDTTMVGNGYPDKVVGLFGKTILLEIKTPERPALTEAEAEFHKKWKGGPVVTARTAQEAKAMIRAVLRKR